MLRGCRRNTNVAKPALGAGLTSALFADFVRLVGLACLVFDLVGLGRVDNRDIFGAYMHLVALARQLDLFLAFCQRAFLFFTDLTVAMRAADALFEQR
jgi:hypothetical protein